MDDDELRRMLTSAAEQFPVPAGPGDMTSRVVRRRRVAVGLSATLGVAATVAVIITLVLAGTGPRQEAQPSSGVRMGYVGSNWRLTSVAKGTTVIAIPASIGAQMGLATNGRFLASDGVNTLSGTFTSSVSEFTVSEVASTAVGYAGRDPRLVAAVTGIDTVANGSGQSGRARDRVISVGRTRLVVQAGAYLLTFVRLGLAQGSA